MKKQLLINYLKSLVDTMQAIRAALNKRSMSLIYRSKLTSQITAINTIIAHIEGGYIDSTY